MPPVVPITVLGLGAAISTIVSVLVVVIAIVPGGEINQASDGRKSGGKSDR